MNQGIGFFGLLTLIFIGLKLAGVGVVATWSWWWVLGAFWIPIVVALPLMIVAGMIGAAVKDRR